MSYKWVDAGISDDDLCYLCDYFKDNDSFEVGECDIWADKCSKQPLSYVRKREVGSMKILFYFHWDLRRMGKLEGHFVATQEQVDNIIGKDVHFGEVLGKHSEIYGTIEADEISVVSRDTEFIEKFEDIVGSAGYNPLNYIEDNDED